LGGSEKSWLVTTSAQNYIENFICNQYEERLAILNTENKKMWINNNFRGDLKNVSCLRFLPHIQKM